MFKQKKHIFAEKMVKTHKDLRVYVKSFDAAMAIFRMTKSFPKEEVYSLTDQIRRSSRSVSANIAEAFRRRRYPKLFVLKLNESEAEAAETQNWLDFSLKSEYISHSTHQNAIQTYDDIIGMLVNMQKNPQKWHL